MNQINHSNIEEENWVEINGASRGTYNFNNQIKSKTSMIRSKLCDYSDSYIHVKGIMTGQILQQQQLQLIEIQK